MIFRCYWCHKELEEIFLGDDSKNFFECPEVHCDITYDSLSKEIIRYSLWVDHNGKRFYIQGWKSSNTTILDLRINSNLSWRWSIQEMLCVDRYLPLKFNEQGLLDGMALFHKLKTLQLFS